MDHGKTRSPSAVLDLAHFDEDTDYIAKTVRFLRNTSTSADRGRFIFTVLYLSVLAFCFLIPLLYYMRCYFESRQEQHRARLESDRMRSAMERSTEVNRAESQAVKRKYVEERRARILQLLEPVRMILKDEDIVNHAVEETHEAAIRYFPEDSDDEDPNMAIRVPAAGLFLDESISLRLAPATCTICLTRYTPGDDIVWSSNSLCDHVFHVDCAQQWLLRQREGPLCPCCRRDFVVDPYDVETAASERTSNAAVTAVTLSNHEGAQHAAADSDAAIPEQPDTEINMP